LGLQLLSAPTLTGFVLALFIVWGAHRVGSLTAPGALAAVVVGTLAASVGWSWCVVLLGFFLSASALSHWRRADKARTLDPIVATPGPRNARQVLANGGVFALAALGALWHEAAEWRWIAFGALAAACADTWSTEVGTAIGGVPRSVRTLRPVPRGTSGAVSLWGLVATLGGAAFIALLASRDAPPLAIAIGGVSGAIADTALGATVQEERWCPRCQRGTERRLHACGVRTESHRGVRGFDNDAVNVSCTLVGAAVAWLVARAVS
jgi:uncharacterized protein (TIGR00297 family)